MPKSILHYAIFDRSRVTGYSVRTHSLAAAQMHNNQDVAIALELGAFFTKSSRRKAAKAGSYYLDDVNYITAIDIYSKSWASKFLQNGNHAIYTLKRLQEYGRGRAKIKLVDQYIRHIHNQIGEFDILHAHSTFFEPCLINSKVGGKFVYEVRGFSKLSMHANSPGVSISSAAESHVKACRSADRCVAICNGIADVLVDEGIPASKIDIVPNGVDTSRLTPGRREEALIEELNLKGKLVFGYITNVRWLEGIQTVVEAWPEIIKAIPEAVFVLIGGGNYLEEVESLIKEKDLSEHFRIAGKVPFENIQSYYDILDVFVVPRLDVPVGHIVTPLKPLEAMAMGKPVLASNVRALKEQVVDGETGVFFEAGNAGSLADACIRLSREESFREQLGKNARDWVTKNRSWNTLVKIYDEVYSTALKSS